MAIVYYLKELGVRLWFSLYSGLGVFCGFFIYKEEFLMLFTRAFGDNRFIFTGVSEVFETYLRLGGLFAALVFLVMVLVNLYLFFLPGLYRYERGVLQRFGFFWLITFSSGMLYIHKVLVQFVCKYLMGYGILDPSIESVFELDFEPRLAEFVSFVIKLDFIFGLCFAGLGTCVLFLWYKGHHYAARWRKWVYGVSILMILLVLPADMVLHINIFLVFVCVWELLVFLLYLCKNYEFAWWNW